MLATFLYSLGLVCRLTALGFTFRILQLNRSWRLVIVALGVSWIVAQPIIQYFLADISPYVTELQRPEVFLIASVVALIVVQQLHQILAKNVSYEQHQTTLAEQTTRRQSLLLKIAKRHPIDLVDGFTPILENGTEELKVTRAGVWLFDENSTSIYSILFINDNALSTDRVQITLAEQPQYFDALARNGSIVAKDAQTHPASSGLTEHYLKPNDIYSLLDIPIRVDGAARGIICFEQTGQERLWTARDQEFAQSLADLGAVIVAQDSQRKIESKLLETQRYLTDAQNTGQFGSFRWDLDTNNMIWSGEVMQRLGYTQGVTPNFIKDILPNVVAPDAAIFLETLTRAQENRQPFRIRLTTIKAKGNRRLEVRGNYVGQTNGKGGAFEGTVQDLTDLTQIEEENRNLENQLVHAQKMETIGTMAGGIAHDFNNILTPILGYADIALSEVSPDSALHHTLSEILHCSLRAKELTEQILVFSRRSDENAEQVDLAQCISSALRLLRSSQPPNVPVELHIDPSTRPIKADPTQMIQIIVNLCTNAWHAMRETNGQLTISLTPCTEDQQSFAVLQIEDTGYGICESELKHIFEPFYTTKGLGEGTGLGLSIVQSIVSKVDGQIKVKSTQGVGTKFTISIPAVAEPLSQTGRVDTSAASSKAASILVIDDEVVARRQY